MPYQDPVTGRLGPFELRFTGNAASPDVGLTLRLPGGAQPLAAGDGGTQLQFGQGEFFFGEESPIQFDENGTDRIVISSVAGVVLPAGPPTVADLARVPPGEIAALRGPQLVEVARRLGTFGDDYATALRVLKFQATSELFGAAGVENLDTLFKPYFDNTADCLLALRTNLVAWAPGPDSSQVRYEWVRGPHWNADAARAGVVAAARLLRNAQLAGYSDAALEGNVRSVACLLRELALSAELEALGLDARTGVIPTLPAGLATYLSLDRAEALDGLRRLLEVQAADQLGLCDPDARLAQAVPAIALRGRDLVVARIHEVQDRFEDRFANRATGRPGCRSGRAEPDLRRRTSTPPRTRARSDPAQPFPGLSLNNAQGDFDNQANPFLSGRTTIGGLDFGPLFRLAPIGNANSLSTEVQLGSVVLASLGLAPRFAAAFDPAQLASDLLGGRALVIHGPASNASRFSVTEGGWDAKVGFAPGPSLHADEVNEVILRATLAGTRRDVLKLSGLPGQSFNLRGAGLSTFAMELAVPALPNLTVELFPGLNLPALPNRTFDLAPPTDGSFEFRLASDGTFNLVGRLAANFPAGANGVFAAGAEVRVDQTGATISGSVGASSGTLRISEVAGQIGVQFSAQLTLPALCALNGRVCLSGPDGGDLVAAGGPGGLCLNGTVLTLRDFAPGATPLHYTLPAFCLDASRNFANVVPASGTTLHGPALTDESLAGEQTQRRPRSLHVDGEAALPVGDFLLDALGGLRLSGGFNSRRIVLDFESVLRLGTLLAMPVQGSVGTDGLRFATGETRISLLGFDFQDISLGVTNVVGELPAVAFTGRLPFLPAPLNTLRFEGELPGSGGFRLEPAQPVSLPSFVPAFPLTDVVPAFAAHPRPFADVVREETPSGYWRMDDDSTVAADSRRTSYFGPITPRNGEYLGNVQRNQPGAPGIVNARAARFDGTSGWVRLPETVPAPTAGGFTVSLWFRRASGAAPISPHTLAGRGSQWSLQLSGSAAEGTRLRWRMDGLQNLDGASLPPLASLKRFGVDDTGWHHVVVVYDGSAQWLYLDGRLDAWQPVRGNMATLVPASTRASLGALSGTGGPVEFFNGWLDEVAFFPTALGPVEILGEWLAAGNGGLLLEGTLPANAIPGLPGVRVGGALGRDGSLAVELASGGAAEFAGLRLPEFAGLVVRHGGTGAVAFRSQVGLPQVESQPLGSVRGLLASDGRFVAEASAFEPRGLLGWDLRLNQFVASGNWQARVLQAELAGDLRLPYGITTLGVSGNLNPGRGEYTLTGSGGGGFNLGTLPFSITSAPKLTDQLFEVGGTLALGAAADSARFSTTLKITQAAAVNAVFGGTTGWIPFGGDTHGQLRWDGQLEYVGGFPEVSFEGTLGLSWPGHPASLDNLADGVQTQTRQDCWTDPLGERHCVDTPVGMSLRLGEAPITVDRRGRTALLADPAFRGATEFGFRLP